MTKHSTRFWRKCRGCGRWLKAKKSRQIGFGTVCQRKFRDAVKYILLERAGQMRLI